MSDLIDEIAKLTQRGRELIKKHEEGELLTAGEMGEMFSLSIKLFSYKTIKSFGDLHRRVERIEKHLCLEESE